MKVTKEKKAQQIKGIEEVIESEELYTSKFDGEMCMFIDCD